MASDIFKSECQVGGAWKIDGAVLTIDGANDIVATRLSLNYARPLTTMIPLNQSKRYMVSGEPMGSLQISAVLGTAGDITSFINKFSDICSVNSNTMTIKPSGITSCAAGSTPLTLTCSGCLIQSMGTGLDKSSIGSVVLMMMDIQMQFMCLSLTSAAS